VGETLERGHPNPWAGVVAGTYCCWKTFFCSGKKQDVLAPAAGHPDGARSILAGIAANQSFATGQVVQIDQLLKI
jgi:hypothetical protein